VVAVSARSGLGLDDLRAAIGRAADGVDRPATDRPPRLYVDRVFTLRGIGTVVTGTLWSGTLGEGDELSLEPGARPVRVRSVQVHDRPVARAEAGQRVALSLPGIDRDEVTRGDALVARGAYPLSYRLDVTLDELQPVPDNARLSVHHGTRRIPARVARIGERYAQLRLTEGVVAARCDRIVLRGSTTVAGGRVLDPAPPRHRDQVRMEQLERGDVAAAIHAPVHVSALRHVLEGELEGIERAGPWAFSASWRAALEADLRGRIERADPLDPGVPVPSEPWATEVTAQLPFERRGAKLYLPGAVATLGGKEADAEALDALLAAAGVAATKVDDADLARFLEREGRLVRLGDGYVIGAGGYEVARDILVTEGRAAGDITLGRFRDLAGTGRRDAQLLLERFDQDGVTRRVGDTRVLRRAARDR
jgi:selenocysteine-specific elongation factor